MTELLTAARMRAIEQAAIASGVATGLDLMERAGRGVIEAVAKTQAEVISLHPVRRSLEGLFVEEAKKESPPREGGV